MSPGLFIVFEGGEGTGKTTQVELLAATLRAGRPGHEVVTTAEPGGTRLATELCALLLRHDDDPMDPRTEAMLYLAARGDHVTRVIRPALTRGATVICDRYVDSTLVYQGHARHLDAHRLEGMSAWVTKRLKPDLVIVLDMNPVEGLARVADRGDANRLDDESLAFHHRVRDGYVRRVAEMRELRHSDAAWGGRTPWYCVVNADDDAETVAHNVAKHVRTLINTRAIAALTDNDTARVPS